MSSWSPTTWPSLSFTSLKRSRSRNSTATWLLGAFGARQRVREAVDEQQAVRQAGQVVVQRLVRERLLGALAVGDVAHLHEVVARVAVGVAARASCRSAPTRCCRRRAPCGARACRTARRRCRRCARCRLGALSLSAGCRNSQRAAAEQAVDRVPEQLGQRGVHRREGLLEIERLRARTPDRSKPCRYRSSASIRSASACAPVGDVADVGDPSADRGDVVDVGEHLLDPAVRAVGLPEPPLDGRGAGARHRLEHRGRGDARRRRDG